MSFQINDCPIGDGHPVYLIAEISANHNHDYNKTVQLIDAAHAAGANAVKLQTYTADTLTLDCDKPHFKIQQGTIWDGQTLHQLYADAAMPWDWQPKLKQHADSIGITLFSSPFDQTAVDFLQSIEAPAYKISFPPGWQRWMKSNWPWKHSTSTVAPKSVSLSVPALIRPLLIQ